MATQTGELRAGITGGISVDARQPRQQIGVRFAGVGAPSFGNTQISVISLTAITAWPATLPQCPILNAFSEQKQPNNVAFTPDVGPPKMRRRSTAAAWSTSVAYRMTVAQLTSFNSFYETSLSDGTLPFSWRHPVQQTTYYWVFDPKDAPKIDRMTPGTFRVSFNLLRLP